MGVVVGGEEKMSRKAKGEGSTILPTVVSCLPNQTGRPK